MTGQSFTTTIDVDKSPEEIFTVLRDVSKWWGKADFKGNSAQLNDEFTIRHEELHFSRQRLIEVIPDRKIVWLVTESKLNWLENIDEWTGTKMIFELTTEGAGTRLRFTHEGLVPGLECYTRCTEGWGMVITDWLFNVITA